MKLSSLSAFPALIKRNFLQAKAELSGQAISRAVRIRTLREIDTAHKFYEKDKHNDKGVRIHSGRCLVGGGQPRPTGIKVRMLDGRPMQYFSDGSLRHALGRAAAKSKAAFKAKRMARRLLWAKRMAA